MGRLVSLGWVLLLSAGVGCTSDSDNGSEQQAGDGGGAGVDETGDGNDETEDDAGGSGPSAQDGSVGSGSPDGGSGSGEDAGPPPDFSCAPDALDTGELWTADTRGQSDTLSGSCGGANSPEAAARWTAPKTDFYRFSTAGSAIDTALYLLDGDCGGSEIACSDDDGALPTSELVLPLTRDQQLVVVADGNADQGEVQLIAEAVSCPRLDLTADILPVQHTTVGQQDNHPAESPLEMAACGGLTQPDRVYRYTAPEAGLYRFEVSRRDTSFTPAVYLFDGPTCDGTLLQCNRAGADGRSHVARQLAAGQHVTVWVDGADSSGPYTLDVSRLDTSKSACIGGTLEARDMLLTTLADGDPHRLSTSCAPTSVWWTGRTDPTQIHDFPELNLAYTAEIPPGCFGDCTLRLEAGFEFAVALSLGRQCDGPEQLCQLATPDLAGEPGAHSLEVQVPDSLLNQPLTLTVERLIQDIQAAGVINDSVQISIESMCFAACP